MALKPASLQWLEDGSLKSHDYDDVYFQRRRGVAESRYVFLEQNNLPARFENLTEDFFHVAELGFGTGMNFLLTAALFLEKAPSQARLVYTSFEKHPLLPADLARIQRDFPVPDGLRRGLQAAYPPLTEGFHTVVLMGGRIILRLCLGDVADLLPQMAGKADAWYLDGFAPAKNPDMWQPGLYSMIAARTVPGGTLATFSAVGDMRRALKGAGFEVRRQKGFAYKYHMTTARMPGDRHARAAKEKITVLGAGIAGASAAHALARRGYNVTVIDRHDGFAQEASGNRAAMLYPKLTAARSPMGEFHLHGFLYARQLLQILTPGGWRACGLRHLETDADDTRRYAAIATLYGADIARHEGGLYHPLGGMLSPVDFCRALLDHPLIETQYGRQARISDDGMTIVALANGSADFCDLPLQPLRGQATLLTPTPASRDLAEVLCDKGYLTPLVDGLHVTGATFQKEPPGDAAPRADNDLENLANLNASFPHFGFTAANIAGARASWRATTPDKLPLIGQTENPAVYISTGFGAHGMSGAPIAGEIIACLIAGEPLPVPQSLMPFIAPERFRLRQERKKPS